MPVPTSFSDLDTVAANNSPPGSETVKGSVDNYLRAAFGFIKTLYTTKAALGANSDITSLTAVTSLNSGPLAGFRNRLINGGMAVDTRNAGAAQTFTAAAALAYCVDRWYGYCTGANVTGQRVAGASVSQYRYQFTGAASVSAIGFGQRIEAANSYDLNGTTATFGIDLANSLLTTVTWTAYYANSADAFGTLASPTRTQIATGTFTVNSTVARYYAQIAVPAAATTGIELVLTVGAQTSGTWTIGKAQFVPGSANETSFEFRPISVEQQLCQRYLPAFVSTGSTDFIGDGYSYDTTHALITVHHQVAPRVPPTNVTTTATSGFTVGNGAGTNTTPSAIALTFGGLLSSSVTFTTTGLTGGQGAYVRANSAGVQILFTGCEL